MAYVRQTAVTTTLIHLHFIVIGSESLYAALYVWLVYGEDMYTVGLSKRNACRLCYVEPATSDRTIVTRLRHINTKGHERTMPMVLTGVPRIRKHIPLTNVARPFVAPDVSKGFRHRGITAVYMLTDRTQAARDIADSNAAAQHNITERESARNLARHIRALSYSDGTYPR